MKIKKLCVGMLTAGSVKTETVFCFVSSMFKTAGIAGCGLHFFMPSGGMVDQARNEAAKEALSVGASHLLFIDSDMIFPEDGILTLASRDKLIIGANYNLRRLPLMSTVKMSDENGEMTQVVGEQIPKYPFKCYAVGTGFMLIRTEVFRILEGDKPWFFYESKEDGTIGEDVNFCKKARAKGIDIWCDPTIEVKHIGDYAY